MKKKIVITQEELEELIYETSWRITNQMAKEYLWNNKKIDKIIKLSVLEWRKYYEH